MRKGMWSAAALVTLVAGAVVVFGAPSLRAADTRVAMGSNNEPLKFLPAEITVPVGAKVEWFNETDIQHDVSADDGSFDSKGLLSRGQKYEFTFTKAGDFKYFCTPHKDADMRGVVKVTGAATPTTTPTTQGGSTATTATTAAGQASTTTTTAKAAAGASSTTTTTAAGNGATTTTLAQATPPASAPETAAETTTTTAAAEGGGEEAAADAAGEGNEKKEKKKNSPIGIAFASVSTLLLAAIAGKLLASKS